MLCDLIIPARDEAENIGPLFDGIDALDQGTVRHVVVTDNGSVDGTAAAVRARDAVVVHEPGYGYGSACLKAIEWISRQTQQPDVVAFLDADCTEDPRELPQLLKPIRSGQAELVIGARMNRAEPGALNAVQRTGNALACTLMAVLTGQRYTDLGPFRAIQWQTLQRLNMAERTWGWTVEMQMKAAILKIPTTEVDVTCRRRQRGRSKISGTISGISRAGTKIITTIFQLSLRRAKIQRAGAPIGKQPG